jgi:glutamine amidotransferase
MRRLREAGLLEVIPALMQPVLGICLGMQLLYEGSEEDDTQCLGILAGTVSRLSPAPGCSVPHMGWNQVLPTESPGRLIPEGSSGYAYFVHSYAGSDGPFATARTEHGGSVVAAVEAGNFFGVQFHPEKSGDFGANLLRRFLSL